MILTALAAIALGQAQLTGNALLDDVQHRAVEFFWNESNPETGFTKDRAGNFKKDAYDVASCAATGFALAAYPIGVEHKWLDRKQALERTKITLDHLLTTHARHNGWFYHFINWKTGERAWNCELSTIDSMILLAGVWQARQYWHDPEVTRQADAITDRIDWKWFMRDVDGKPDHEFFNMGWKPESGFLKATWAGYCELLMIYIQAYGASDVRTDGWDKITKNLYTYNSPSQSRDIQVIEGGPLFMHQMSNVFYDFSNKRDRDGWNYWKATQNATLENRAYCIDNPKGFKGYGAGFWGLTACDTPSGYSGPGAPPRNESDDGTVAPTCALASLEYTPKESMEMAESCYRDHRDAYGRYGFSNGINPSKAWVDPDVIGIDLGMMLLGVEDARTGLPHKLSNSYILVRRGFARAGLRPAPGSNDGPIHMTK